MKIVEIIKEDEGQLNAIDPFLLGLAQRYNFVESRVKRLCAPYLQEIGGVEQAIFKRPLWRGVTPIDRSNLGIDESNPYTAIVVNKNRRSKDTPVELQLLIDNWFENKTGIRFRSASLFCTGSKIRATTYGPEVVIIPIKQYHYCWSLMYDDMYNEFSTFLEHDEDISGEFHDMPRSYKERFVAMFKKYPDKLEEFLAKGQYQFDSGLTDAIRSGNEIMVSADEAVVLDDMFVGQCRFYYENRIEEWNNARQISFNEVNKL